MKNNLIKSFSAWLKKYSNIKLMHTYSFAEYEIARLLEQEAPGEILAEDEAAFTAAYEYSFSLAPRHSTDGKPHRFSFEAKILAEKENISENDYDIKAYKELEFIIK